MAATGQNVSSLTQRMSLLSMKEDTVQRSGRGAQRLNIFIHKRFTKYNFMLAPHYYELCVFN